MTARASTRTSATRRRSTAPTPRRTPGRSRSTRRGRPSAAVRARRRALVVVGGWAIVVLTVVGLTVASGAARSGTVGLVCFDAAGAPVDPLASVAGYGAEQLTNAKAIVDAGAALGAPREAQEIAVMTAMGESGLRVLDRGDAAGPDSRGLFQQRDNGAWGSYDDRMNPSVSADNFYRALLALPGWQELEPTVAAHRVQRNADEGHYERYFPAAQEVVAAVATPSLECRSEAG